MNVHGNNLEQKENHSTKYRDNDSRCYLAEIRIQYDAWKAANLALVGPTKQSTSQDLEILAMRVALFNSYKDFIDQKHYAEKFDSRSNLHSSVLEEFMFYLFKDLVASISNSALIGKSHTFKDPLHNLFFCFPHPIKSTSYKREFVGNWGYAEVP